MWIAVPTDDGVMQSYVAAPATGRCPAIVVLQEAFGVNAYLRGVVDELAAAGYVALAPELLHRSGTHVELPYDDLPRVMTALADLDAGMLERDVTAAVAAVRARPDVDPARVGVIGFCLGGYAALLTGLSCDVQSIVAFYPGGLVHVRPKLKLVPLAPRLRELRAPTMLQLGGADAGIPAADASERSRAPVARGRERADMDRAVIRAALAESPARHAITVHPDAKHGFHTHDRAVYDGEAARLAWEQTLAWLSDTLRA